MSQEEMRELTPDDASAVWEVLRDDGGVTERVEGRSPRRDDADVLFAARPPGVGAERKHTLGWVENDTLVAVADVIEGWPQAGTNHLGLLQVSAAHRGRGVGGRFHDAVLARFPDASWRLSVVETNSEGAVPFWRALGYRETARTPWHNERGDASTTILMERPVTLS